jgi:type IV pilus assembly protein PilN
VKITLNLATRPYADQGPALKRLRIGMAALAVVLIGLGFGLLHFHQSALRMKAQEEILDRSIAQIRREEQGYQAQMQQPANARVLTQAGFLNQLFEEKSFSWTAAMEDLERVLPGGVQVTAIEPVRAKDGRLTLRLRIAGLRERTVEMMRNMERSQRFASPRISGENAEGNNPNVQQAAEPNRVSFDLLAEYNPATLEERRVEIEAQKHGHGAAGAKPARVTAPVVTAPVVPPQYVPPNPQPVQPGRPRPRRVPQNGQPMPVPRKDQGPPTGFDPNGLQNHERNRIPPPGFPPDNTLGDPK